MRQCLRKALVVQDGWAVWQPGRSTVGRDQPALCTSLNRTCTANTLIIVMNKISRYMYPYTYSAPKPQVAEFPQFCFKLQLLQKPEYCVLNYPDNSTHNLFICHWVSWTYPREPGHCLKMFRTEIPPASHTLCYSFAGPFNALCHRNVTLCFSSASRLRYPAWLYPSHTFLSACSPRGHS